MKNILTIFAIAAAVVVGTTFLVKTVGGGVAESVDSVNEGTPFEGAGVVGTVGNVTDALSGRTLSTFGSFLGLQGSKLFNFFKEGEFK